MNFVQIKKKIGSAESFEDLFCLMKTARASTRWSTYKEVEREKLIESALQRSEELDSQERASRLEWKEKIQKAAQRMRHPSDIVHNLF